MEVAIKAMRDLMSYCFMVACYYMNLAYVFAVIVLKPLNRSKARVENGNIKGRLIKKHFNFNVFLVWIMGRDFAHRRAANKYSQC